MSRTRKAVLKSELLQTVTVAFRRKRFENHCSTTNCLQTEKYVVLRSKASCRAKLYVWYHIPHSSQIRHLGGRKFWLQQIILFPGRPQEISKWVRASFNFHPALLLISFTVMLPCIVIDFLLNNQPDTLIIKIYSVIKLYMFRASSLSIIRSFLLYIRHW
jgi:hypothetical protein